MVDGAHLQDLPLRSCRREKIASIGVTKPNSCHMEILLPVLTRSDFCRCRRPSIVDGVHDEFPSVGRRKNTIPAGKLLYFCANNSQTFCILCSSSTSRISFSGSESKVPRQSASSAGYETPRNASALSRSESVCSPSCFAFGEWKNIECLRISITKSYPKPRSRGSCIHVEIFWYRIATPIVWLLNCQNRTLGNAISWRVHKRRV